MRVLGSAGSFHGISLGPINRGPRLEETPHREYYSWAGSLSFVILQEVSKIRGPNVDLNSRSLFLWTLRKWSIIMITIASTIAITAEAYPNSWKKPYGTIMFVIIEAPTICSSFLPWNGTWRQSTRTTQKGKCSLMYDMQLLSLYIYTHSICIIHFALHESLSHVFLIWSAILGRFHTWLQNALPLCHLTQGLWPDFRVRPKNRLKKVR